MYQRGTAELCTLPYPPIYSCSTWGKDALVDKLQWARPSHPSGQLEGRAPSIRGLCFLRGALLQWRQSHCFTMQCCSSLQTAKQKDHTFHITTTAPYKCQKLPGSLQRGLCEGGCVERHRTPHWREADWLFVLARCTSSYFWYKAPHGGESKPSHTSLLHHSYCCTNEASSLTCSLVMRPIGILAGLSVCLKVSWPDLQLLLYLSFLRLLKIFWFI